MFQWPIKRKGRTIRNPSGTIGKIPLVGGRRPSSLALGTPPPEYRPDAPRYAYMSFLGRPCSGRSALALGLRKGYSIGGSAVLSQSDYFPWGGLLRFLVQYDPGEVIY